MKILLRLCALLLVTFLLFSITYASASSVQDHRVLSCSPKTLHSGDTLKLTLGPKHGRELGIKDEHGNFFFLVLESSDPRTFELMTPEQFKRARKVEISTNLRAVPAPVTPKPRLF